MEGDATILCTMTNEPIYGLHVSKDDKGDTKKHLAYRMSGDMFREGQYIDPSNVIDHPSCWQFS